MIAEFVRHSGLAPFQLASLIFFVGFYVVAISRIFGKKNTERLNQVSMQPLQDEQVNT